MKLINHINQQPTCKKGGTMPETEKEFWYKIEDSLYDEKEEEDFRRIRSHVKNEIEEKKEEKYKQLEFDFDLVAPI